MVKNVQNQDQMQAVSNYSHSMGGMYSMIKEQRTVVKSRGGAEPMPMMMAMPRGSAGTQIQSRVKQSDEMSSNVYANTRINSRKFQKKE